MFAGEDVDGDVLQYTAQCLSDILDGVDPQTALNIELAEVDSGIDLNELIDIAVSVELCLRLYKTNKVDAPVQLAIETVAEAVGKNYDTVRDIRDKYSEPAMKIADRKIRK